MGPNISRQCSTVSWFPPNSIFTSLKILIEAAAYSSGAMKSHKQTAISPQLSSPKTSYIATRAHW